MGKHEPRTGYAAWLAGVLARLKATREDLGLTFRAAGERTGIPYASIQRVEAGRVRPTLELLYSLAAAYGVHISDLLCDASGKKSKK
jgi:transcriptional regulator with XRE-family HTH domain